MTDALARLTSALADRYTVEREIGSGGMVTVYLAEDLKLHRDPEFESLRDYPQFQELIRLWG